MHESRARVDNRANAEVQQTRTTIHRGLPRDRTTTTTIKREREGGTVVSQQSTTTEIKQGRNDCNAHREGGETVQDAQVGCGLRQGVHLLV